MNGPTLDEIRDHIETLASESGEYALLCARHGEHPVPTQGLRFESRATARAAARATEQYRAALRRYDPELPVYDVVVRQETERGQDGDDAAAHEGACATTPQPDEPNRRLVEFCHRTAAAVFESLTNGGYDAVAATVMECYYGLAESEDPDALCLSLLEAMARELSARLSPEEQVDVLTTAAGRLGPRSRAAEPVAAAFTDLQGCGLVGEFSRSGWSVGDDGNHSVAVRLSEYALSPEDGHLPVLPIVVDLLRRGMLQPPTSMSVQPTDEGWELTLVLARESEPDGLTTAPIRTAPSA